MKVKEIMEQDIDVIDSSGSRQEAAEKMKELDVGYLPVVVDKDVVGIITDRDVVTRVVAKGMMPKGAKVVDGMTKRAVWVRGRRRCRDSLKIHG